MAVAVEKNEEKCSLKINESMNIYSACDIKKKMFEGFSDCSEIEIDLSDVTEMDSAGFQLLILVRREAERLKKSLRIVSMSHVVSSLMALYRMEGYFQSQGK